MHVIVIGWLHGKPHPNQGYGGIEKTVPVVCAELARQGHQVTLLAPAGSQVEGVEVIETSDMVEATNIVNSLQCDVVHDNTIWDLQSPIRQGIRHPYICVSHVMHAIGWSKNVVYLSKSQRTQHGIQVERNLNESPVVYVPINPELKPTGLPRQGYLLFLGTVGEHKGVVEAAEIAHYLGRTLKVAGPAWGEYADRVARMPNVEMIGEVCDPQRSNLIEQSYAMMCCHTNTGGWSEPGCGVVGEAMAFGTPVAALPNGCLSEMIVTGENGWIRNTVDELAELMCVSPFPLYPFMIQEYQRRWSAENIVHQYVSLYESVISGQSWG